jgi:lysine-specific histone demethylase 1
VALEEMSSDEVAERVMRRLRQYHPDRNIPRPVDAVVTQWGKDEFTRGSYSSVPPGCAGATDYKELAANVEGRVFFAGEATSYCYPAQMHGAFDSGLREVCHV